MKSRGWNWNKSLLLASACLAPLVFAADADAYDPRRMPDLPSVEIHLEALESLNRAPVAPYRMPQPAPIEQERLLPPEPKPAPKKPAAVVAKPAAEAVTPRKPRSEPKPTPTPKAPPSVEDKFDAMIKEAPKPQPKAEAKPLPPKQPEAPAPQPEPVTPPPAIIPAPPPSVKAPVAVVPEVKKEAPPVVAAPPMMPPPLPVPPPLAKPEPVKEADEDIGFKPKAILPPPAPPKMDAPDIMMPSVSGMEATQPSSLPPVVEKKQEKETILPEVEVKVKGPDMVPPPVPLPEIAEPKDAAPLPPMLPKPLPPKKVEDEDSWFPKFKEEISKDEAKAPAKIQEKAPPADAPFAIVKPAEDKAVKEEKKAPEPVVLAPPPPLPVIKAPEPVKEEAKPAEKTEEEDDIGFKPKTIATLPPLEVKKPPAPGKLPPLPELKPLPAAPVSGSAGSLPPLTPLVGDAPDEDKSSPLGFLSPKGEVKSAELPPSLPELPLPGAKAKEELAKKEQELAALPPAPKSGKLVELEQSGKGAATLQISYTTTETDVPLSVREQLVALSKGLKDDQRIQLIAYASGTEEQASMARRVSLARALAMQNFLVDQGVSIKRILVDAQGNKNSGGPEDRVDVFVKN